MRNKAGKARKEHSIQFNFIMNFVLSASSVLFPLISVPYVSRILLPPGTGKVAWAISIVTYFTMIAMLGIPTYGIKAIARVRDDHEKLSRTAVELLSINLVMTTLSYILFFTVLALVPQMREEKTLFMICSLAILLNSVGVTWFYQGIEEYGYIAVVSIAAKVVAIIFMFLAIHTREDYLWYALMSLISSYGSNIINFLRLPFYITWPGLKNLTVSIHIRAVLTFFAMSVATTVYTNLDTVMLGFIRGDAETGLYNEAIKIKTLMVTLITSLGAVLLPRMSGYYARNEMERFEALFSKSLSFVLLVSLPSALFFAVYAPIILWILSGDAYVAAAPAMIALMPTIVLIGCSNLTGIQVLVPTDREGKVLLSVAAGAVFNLAANAFLIPGFGALGAACATTMAELLVLLIQMWYLRDLLKKVFPRIEWQYIVKAFVFSMPALLIVFAQGYTARWLVFLLGGVAYFLAYFSILFLSREPILMESLARLKSLVSRAGSR